MSSYRTTGLYFEEFPLGMKIITEGRTITDSDIVNFAGVSGDFNPLHTDEQYASQTPFGKRVAHGALVFAIATGLSYRMRFMEKTGIAFRSIDDWKFSAPVYVGDTIHCLLEVTALKEAKRLGGGLVTLAIKVINQADAVVQRGNLTVIIAMQPEQEAEA